jgi:hypothetical protein
MHTKQTAACTVQRRLQRELGARGAQIGFEYM